MKKTNIAQYGTYILFAVMILAGYLDNMKFALTAMVLLMVWGIAWLAIIWWDILKICFDL